MSSATVLGGVAGEGAAWAVEVVVECDPWVVHQFRFAPLNGL